MATTSTVGMESQIGDDPAPHLEQGFNSYLQLTLGDGTILKEVVELRLGECLGECASPVNAQRDSADSSSESDSDVEEQEPISVPLYSMEEDDPPPPNQQSDPVAAAVAAMDDESDSSDDSDESDVEEKEPIKVDDV